MICPRCFRPDVTLVDTHYVCNNDSCVDSNGKRTQFSIQTDSEIRFPYNQIFAGRNVTEFYRMPYLTLGSSGVSET